MDWGRIGNQPTRHYRWRRTRAWKIGEYGLVEALDDGLVDMSVFSVASLGCFG